MNEKHPKGIQVTQIEDFNPGTAINFVAYLLDTMDNAREKYFGKQYKKKNNFSYKQKIKILNYIFIKNFQDLQQKNKQFTQKIDDNKKTITNRLELLDSIDHHNRTFLIQQLGECQQKLRFNGSIYGAVVGATLIGLMKNQSLIKKLSLSISLVYFGGSYALYRNIDRIFDPLYVFFKKDMETFLKQEKSQNQDAGKVKFDEIDMLLQQSRELYKDASIKS